MKIVRGILATGFLLVGMASAEDYLGVRFDVRTYGLCEEYGCTVILRRRLVNSGGKIVTLRLRDVGGKLHLTLSQYDSVMALELWLAGKFRPEDQKADLLYRVVNNAAQQVFTKSRVARCFNSLTQSNSSYALDDRAVIMTDFHYGVHCLKKTYRGEDLHGVRIYFDH